MLNYTCPSCHNLPRVFGGRTCHWPPSAEGSENTVMLKTTLCSDLPAVPCTLFVLIPGLRPRVQS